MSREQRKEILQLSEKLVAIPSVTGREAESTQALDVVGEYLDSSLTTKDFKRNGVTSRLWWRGDNIKNFNLLLVGHVDVVDAPQDQFEPRIEDDKLFGRGAGDMKGHVAAMAVAYNRLVHEGSDEGVGLLLTSDEEKGGFDGARYVLEQGLRTKIAFVPDGDFDFNIVSSQKAPHHVLLKATGSGGHASRAFEIENPINRIMGFYSDMRRKYSLASKESDWHSTFEMTRVWTPEDMSENSIPNLVHAWFSWRWPLEEFGFAEGREDIEVLCKQYNCEVIKEHGFGEGCYTDREEEPVTTWEKVIEEVTGKSIGFQNMHGATDGRHFYKYGAKVLSTSGITKNHHTDNEWVSIPSLEQLSEAIYRFGKSIKSNE